MKDNLKGYEYIKSIIIAAMYYKKQSCKAYMTILYESVARKYSKDIRCIEKNIRYLKNKCWKYKSLTTIEKTLGYSFNYNSSIPTNGELILILVECIRIMIGA